MTIIAFPDRGVAPTVPGLPIRLTCTGCGHQLPVDAPLRLRCPMARAGDDIDHVLARSIDPVALRFPVDGEPNPFVRFRQLLYGYHLARAAGHGDDDIAATIAALDRSVAAVDGSGFRITPFTRSPRLSRRLGFTAPGGVWAKDETGNVSGSHKARHLFGTLLGLQLAGAESTAPLAIASCGNAALAAAVVARAAERELLVFIPPEAPPTVVARLRELRARIEVCERVPGAAGDPTYERLRQVVEEGATPFTCQGSLNGLAIEGGMTLGWEIVADLAREHRRLDHLVVQVGGGALASAVVAAFEEARELGVIAALPRFHSVQSASVHPLQRAHARLSAELGPDPSPADVDRALTGAAHHRSRYMWPWETTPHSVASGILDDETYDWLAVMRGMLRTGGVPLVVDEPGLRAANRLARRAAESDVDHTGSAGLAGLMELVRTGAIGADESVAVIFTGVRRTPPADGAQP
ncbi:MAG TPA: pyridoxal-phosphate dependent enzyme [Candidatus Limnocylindria bacterium]